MLPSLKPLPPKDAIAYFRQKGLEPSFAWQDVWQEEHAKAFTVAKMMSRDMLQDTREALDVALSDGLTFEQFKSDLAPKLKAKGWWGKALMTDPADGEVKTVQLGSHRRLQTIFDVNMRTSYMQGSWQRIQRTKNTFPYLMYDAVGDSRTRPLHRAWSGTCLPVDHPWWDTHYPPCGWRCRCGVVSLTRRMMDKRGLAQTVPAQGEPVSYTNPRTGEVTTIERGIDPGFNYNVGRAPLRSLSPRPARPKPGIAGIASNPSKEAAKGFLRAFGADEKPRVIKDRDNWPLPMGEDLFKDAKRFYTVPRPDQVGDLPKVATALKTYDHAEWLWARNLRSEAEIRAGIEAVVGGRAGKALIGPVARPMSELAKGHGLKLDDFSHALDSQDVAHIFKQHGDAAKESARGLVAVVSDDFKRLASVMDVPDYVIFGGVDKGGLAVITWVKGVQSSLGGPNETWVYVGTVRPGLREVLTKTFYKHPATTDVKSVIASASQHVQNGGGAQVSVVDLTGKRKVWQSFAQQQLVRRYTKTLDNQVITIDFSGESWTYDIRPKD